MLAVMRHSRIEASAIGIRGVAASGKRDGSASRPGTCSSGGEGELFRVIPFMPVDTKSLFAKAEEAGKARRALHQHMLCMLGGRGGIFVFS